MTPILRGMLPVVAACALLAVVLALPPIPQPAAYHAFAATETLFGIPNFGDVVSNLAFVLAGLFGLSWLLRTRVPAPFGHSCDAWPYVTLFATITLVGAGSAYYHWDPDNPSLYWDRLPMSLAFMSLFAAILGERMPPRTTCFILPALLFVGIAGATHWILSELQEAGDLRFYLLIQGIPIILGPLLMLLYRTRYTRSTDFLVAGGWYLLALLAQALDHPIHALTGGWISGHTLKHLLAAIAVLWILRMLVRRSHTALAA